MEIRKEERKYELKNEKLQQQIYIFVSHSESDECGGLRILLDYFPNAKPVCSQVTARQIMGFGLASDIIIKAPGEMLETSSFRLSFLTLSLDVLKKSA